MKVRAKLSRLPQAPPLVRQAAVYTASSFVGKAIPFLLLPVLTRFMSPVDYGIVSMFLLTAMILDPFISLSLPGAISVMYYDRSINLPSYIGSGIAMTIGVAALFALPLFLLRDPISNLTQVPATWLLLVIPLVLARAVGGILLTLLRVRERATLFGLLQNLQSVGLIALILLLVVLLGRQWYGRLEAELISWFLFAGASLFLLLRWEWLRLAFVKRYAWHIARFGIPLIPHMLGGVLMVQTDRLFLTNLVGVGETGLYTVGYQLTLVIQLVAVSFNNAYAPWLFRNLTDADDETKRKLVRYTYLDFVGMMVLSAAVAIAMPWLAVWLLDESFAGAGQYVGWLAIGSWFSSMYYMVTNYIFFAQKTSWLAAVTIVVALTNVPLTYGLISLNGGVGAAQAAAISLGLSFALTWIVSQRAYPMPWLRGLMNTTQTH